MNLSPDKKNNPALAAIVPVFSLLLLGARWLWQGSGNLYDRWEKKFAIPDPDLGWRWTDTTVVWVGLMSIGLVLGVVLSIWLAAWVIRRREKRTQKLWKLPRKFLWVAGLVTVLYPAYAWQSGGRPEGGVDNIPKSTLSTQKTQNAQNEQKIAASLTGIAAGRYEVAAVASTGITAQVKSGGEEFDARFVVKEGFWSGNPADLAQPMTAKFIVDPHSIDTGIALRNKHAAEEFKAEAHPLIVFTLDKITSASAVSPTTPGQEGVQFRGTGSLLIAGKAPEISVIGVVRKLDAKSRNRLGMTGTVDAFIVKAEFAVELSKTGMDPGDTFDKDTVPVVANVVLVKKE